MAASREEMKVRAGLEAAEIVDSGMVLGLGTGSTVYHFMVGLSRRINRGEVEVCGVPTSRETERLARELGVPLTTLEEHPTLDLDIDGADEVDRDLNLIKGGGGAHVREKIIASATRRLVIVVDEGKLSSRLGEKARVPVEVIPIAVPLVTAAIVELGGNPEVRPGEKGKPLVTDNENLILDCDFGRIDDPSKLEARINAITGVVDCGLFCGMAGLVIVGTSSGTRRMERS